MPPVVFAAESLGDVATSNITHAGTMLPSWMREKNVRYDVAGRGWSKWRISYIEGGKKRRSYIGYMSYKAVDELRQILGD